MSIQELIGGVTSRRYAHRGSALANGKQRHKGRAKLWLCVLIMDEIYPRDISSLNFKKQVL